MAIDLRSFNLKRNMVSAVFAFVINIGLVFLSYRLVIRQGGLEVIGLWSTLYAWTTMIRIGDAGMANASLRFIALCNPQTEGEKLRDYLETGIKSGNYMQAKEYIRKIEFYDSSNIFERISTKENFVDSLLTILLKDVRNYRPMMQNMAD